jgi:glycosyltransferase involved in cell wall biosynthesis
MHIVIVHGYILNGTGSNIYTINLAKSYKNMGHAVTIVCQDLNSLNYDFVDELICPTNPIPPKQPLDGTVRVIVPDINNLLPVYVYDKYEGFDVKTIPDCTDEEIELHISKMVYSLEQVVRQSVDLLITNHALLSPCIVARVLQNHTIPHICKIHGSALTFVLKDNYKYKKYAIEGLGSCDHIIAGTLHIKNYLYDIFGATVSAKLDFKNKIVIIPPGMDPDIFQLLDNIQSNQTQFLQKIKHNDGTGRDHDKMSSFDHNIKNESLDNVHRYLVDRGATYNQRSVDNDLLSRMTNNRIDTDEPLIIYFGKFLNTKGVGEVLVTFPTILKQFPKARLLLVGFGEYREHLEAMIRAMKWPGDIDLFTKCAMAGDFVDAMDFKKWFRPLIQSNIDRITVTGCLDHQQLGKLLPLASIAIVGSKANEAFGMVAVEAMACGVLPIMNYHSGIIDCLKVVESTDPELAEIMSIPVKQGGVHGTADGSYLVEQLVIKVSDALNYRYADNNISIRLREIVINKFSWKSICQEIIQLVQ